MGFDARWGVLGAADIGANHQRDRIWIVAKSNGKPIIPPPTLAHANSTYEQRNERTKRTQAQHANTNGTSELAHAENGGNVWRNWVMGFAQEEHKHRGGQSNGRSEWWQTEPNVDRVVDGLASRVDRLKAIGNGQVPLCAATAWQILSK
jgi:DNA (cytosine-5)-methyltransferase 1